MNKQPVDTHKSSPTDHLVGVILLRSTINASPSVRTSLKLMQLYKKNFCVVHPQTPSFIGMVKSVKDYVTWGEVSHEVHAALQQKRKSGNGKKYFRLNSPKKGYGRKGIKVTFQQGGALGYRGEKMDDLIQRMM